MKTKGLLVAGLIVAAIVAPGLPAPASAQLTRAGVVTNLQGTVTVARATAPQPSPLSFKDDVFVLDRITTGDESVARMLLGGKAVVTARERSVLHITESVMTSTVHVGGGRVAVAVVKDRMKPGELIEIRTPNAVAGVRGTVVIVEVFQATAAAGGSIQGAFTSRFTVLKGVVDVVALDAAGRAAGPPVILNRLQTTSVTGAAAPRQAQDITPADGQRLGADFQVGVGRPVGPDAGVIESQMEQAKTERTDANGRTPAIRDLAPRGESVRRAPILPGGEQVFRPPVMTPPTGSAYRSY